MDHPFPIRIAAEQFDDTNVLDDFLLDVRTELKEEQDGFETGLFVEVLPSYSCTIVVRH